MIDALSVVGREVILGIVSKRETQVSPFFVYILKLAIELI